MTDYQDNTLFVNQVSNIGTLKYNITTISSNIHTLTSNLNIYPAPLTLSSLVTTVNTISGNFNNTLNLNNISISGNTVIGTTNSNSLTINSLPSFNAGINVPSGNVRINNIFECGILYCDQIGTISGNLKLYSNIDMTNGLRIAIPSTANLADEPVLNTNNLGYTIIASSNVNNPLITTSRSIYTPTNAISITLPYAGIWSITWSIILYSYALTSTIDRIIAMLGNTAASFDYNESAYNNYTSQTFTNGIPFTINGVYTFIGNASTLYLNYNIYQDSFINGTLTANYKITATRIA